MLNSKQRHKLIRLAATLPKGDPSRKSLLKNLQAAQEFMVNPVGNIPEIHFTKLTRINDTPVVLYFNAEREWIGYGGLRDPITLPNAKVMDHAKLMLK